MRQGQAWRTYPTAQGRLVLGALAAWSPPLLGRAARAAAGEPKVEEVRLAGVPATLFRPGRGRGPWPAVVVLTGITRRGRRHPAFLGVGRALGAMGHVAALVEPEGLSAGELSPALADASKVAFRAVAGRPDVRSGVALAGVSGGATLALLVAAARDVADEVASVAALAPCCDIEQALRTVTTETYRVQGEERHFAPGGFARLVVARSVVASLPPGADREALLAHLRDVPDDEPDPMAALRAWEPGSLQDDGRRVLALLANRDPARFDELYAALPDVQRQGVAALSAVRIAEHLRAPVEIVVGRTDKYVPLADARAFTARCPTARLTVVESLTHAVPQLGLRELRSLAQLDAALVRSLAAVRSRT